MGKPTTVKREGETIEGMDLDFEVVKEDWNQYKLEDGSTIKVKVVVSKIIRTNKYLPNGEPIYVVQSGNILSTWVPDNLKETEPDTEEKH